MPGRMFGQENGQGDTLVGRQDVGLAAGDVGRPLESEVRGLGECGRSPGGHNAESQSGKRPVVMASSGLSSCCR